MPKKDKLKSLRQKMRRNSYNLRHGALAQTFPVSERFGSDRGTPIDRYYIEQFLGQFRHRIRGDVLEVKDSKYTTKFGSDLRLCDILDVDPANTNATLIADLSGTQIPENRYDCFVCTQTLQYIYDLQAAVKNMLRLLKPGGTLLVTVPSISKTVGLEAGLTDYWRFTKASCQHLFRESFGDEVKVITFGNPMSCSAFLFGFAMEEVPKRRLDESVDQFPMLCGVVATKDGRRSE